MSRLIEFFRLAAIALALVIAACVQSFGVTLNTAPQSLARLEGGSTLHNWMCKSTDVRGEIKTNIPSEKLKEIINNIAAAAANGLNIDESIDSNVGPPGVWIKMPVDAFNCGNWYMERDMRMALKSDSNPDIEFKFIRAIGAGVKMHEDSVTILVDVEGALSLSGVSSIVVFHISVDMQTPEEFRIQTRKTIRMTDFDISPPKAFFGLLRAHDELDVILDLKFITMDTGITVERAVVEAGHPGVANPGEL